MFRSKASTFSATLRAIGLWQLAVFEEVLRQGVKVTYTVIDKRRRLPPASDVMADPKVDAQSAAASQPGRAGEVGTVSQRPPASDGD